MRNAFRSRSVFWGLAGSAALAALMSVGAQAQAPASGDTGKSGGQASGADAGDKLKDIKITLNADQENLVEALRSLLKSGGVDFMIDPDLKGGTVTAHLKDVPFKDALATVLKVSTLPIKYELKDGIYHFMRRPDDPPPVEKPAEPPADLKQKTQAGKIPVDQLSSSAATHKLLAPYNSQPPILYSHSTLPGSHGQTSSFGFSNGTIFSNGAKFNPDGSISTTGSPPINIFNLLHALLGGGHR